MKKKLVLLALSCTTLFASRQETILSEITANQDVCVRDFTEDKIYLNHSRILATSDGFFLQLNSENYLPIPLLYADQHGYYIPIRDEWSLRYWTCPVCGRENSVWTKKCSGCSKS
ncbi:MAG: hypothetical protein FJZ63_06530 [Chlamydiae bacterium]|nr:hypothetical protein [Chlamydiota bacterium]